MEAPDGGGRPAGDPTAGKRRELSHHDKLVALIDSATASVDGDRNEYRREIKFMSEIAPVRASGRKEGEDTSSSRTQRMTRAGTG